MLKKFEKVELGMTREDVEKIMGDPDATYGTAPSGDVFDMVEYGYLDSAFWYYRDVRYDKMLKESKKAKENLDFSFEAEPWTQIRFTFDKTGALIEAYYNAAYDSGLWNDYGTGTKTIQSLELIGEPPVIKASALYNDNAGFPTAGTALAKIVFVDGSIYVGKINLAEVGHKIGGSDPAEGIISFEHPWVSDEMIVLEWQ